MTPLIKATIAWSTALVALWVAWVFTVVRSNKYLKEYVKELEKNIRIKDELIKLYEKDEYEYEQ